VPASVVRPQLAKRISERVPAWSDRSFICHEDLRQFRSQYVQGLLEEELGEVDRLERSVVEAIARHETAPVDFEAEFGKDRTLGERTADRVASFGGSWQYIILFGVFMVAWMGLNSLLLATHPFDAYPYILLNLVLSCLSAVQAPIIMMSQNRQEARDRARARNDYHVNIKAEVEVRLLHEKMDHLLRHQLRRWSEIQQVQAELVADQDRGAKNRL
jgi:uncharacterized membrane protein